MGRKLSLRPGPEPDDLGTRSIHEVIRDYPEALVALRRADVDVAAEGGRRLGELGRGDEVIAVILAATSWRPDPPTIPSNGTTVEEAVAESDPVPPTPGGA